MRRRVVSNLWKRYVVALSLFAGLAVATFLTVWPMNVELHHVEVAINRSGRQRSLSQRIALLALERAINADASDPKIQHQLDASLHDFATANEILAEANLPRAGLAPTELQAIYYQSPQRLAARSRAFVATVSGLTNLPHRSILDTLRIAGVAKDELLPLLNQATAAYERKAHVLTRRVQTTELLAALAALLLIVFEAMLIFWPAQRHTRAVMDELEDAIDVLHIRERNLSEAARLSRLAEEMAGVGHWRLDASTGQIDWSPQVFAIYGLEVSTQVPDLEAAIGAYHPDDRDTVRRHTTDLLTDGRGFEFELRLVRADGAIRTVLSKGAAEYGPTGAVEAIFGVFMDVTEARQDEAALKDSEARYRLLAENGTDIISKTSLDGKIKYISPSIFQISGYSASEFLAQSAFKFLHPDDRDRVIENFFQTIEGKFDQNQIEYRLVHKDGHVIWLEGSPRLARNPDTGAIIGVTDLVRDISAHKALEANLQSAKIEAEAATVAKSEFLANMSHELRTPLTSIQGFGQLLAEQSELNAHSRHYANRILTASKSLMRIINDLLDFSKLEHGQLPLDVSPNSIRNISIEVHDLLLPLANAKNISLKIKFDKKLPDTLMLDGDRIRQIMLNLIGNAIKFTQLGSVDISLTYDPLAARLTCAVTDTGLGISEDHLQRLFKRFSQIDGSSTRHHGGTGLGLAISKGLVDMMGGRIGVESVAGDGSTFWFEVPAVSAALASPIALDAGRHLESVRVLVVDDQEGTRDVVAALLTPCGAEIFQASNGQEAVEMSARMPFDVILMDIRMPVLDGISAVAAIRSGQGPNSTIPIVAFSADVGSAALGDLDALGFDGQIAKPLASQQLISTLRSLVFSDQNPAPRVEKNYGA